MSRAYHVCKKCGPSSWIFQDRVGSNPFCKKCGCQWPKATQQKPNAVAGGDWANRADPARVWKTKGPKAGRDRAEAPVSTAQRALSTVWDALPPAARQAIEHAGWQPKQPAPPPGLGGSNRAVRLVKGGEGKGKGANKAAEHEDQPDESVKALFASASDHQKELLTQCGFSEPEGPQPDLIEMCKKHMSELPSAIRELVEEPPEKPLSAFEQLNDTSKKFKTATVELRELIMKKAALQLKINKHKEVYTSMLNDMKTLDTNLCGKQDQVTLLQQQLQSSVVAEVAESRLDIESALVKSVDHMPLEQLEAFRDRFCGIIAEKVSLKKQSELPDAHMPDQASQGPLGPPGGSPGDEPAARREGKGRSRSRGRGGTGPQAGGPPGPTGAPHAGAQGQQQLQT
ncbi:unnamed protein product [Symbiodinium sp. CCMP2592]|nr:unnamed protein product [Symbiodinium sp. CCMP2592]